MQGAATPGLYARLRSLCVLASFVGITSILPGLPWAWYSRACNHFASFLSINSI